MINKQNEDNKFTSCVYVSEWVSEWVIVWERGRERERKKERKEIPCLEQRKICAQVSREERRGLCRGAGGGRCRGTRTRTRRVAGSLDWGRCGSAAGGRRWRWAAPGARATRRCRRACRCWRAWGARGAWARALRSRRRAWSWRPGWSGPGRARCPAGGAQPRGSRAPACPWDVEAADVAVALCAPRHCERAVCAIAVHLVDDRLEVLHRDAVRVSACRSAPRCASTLARAFSCTSWWCASSSIDQHITVVVVSIPTRQHRCCVRSTHVLVRANLTTV